LLNLVSVQIFPAYSVGAGSVKALVRTDRIESFHGCPHHLSFKKNKRGKRLVVLVALGLGTDGSGKGRILDWEVADQEEQANWERLGPRLCQRGVKLETGLQALVGDASPGLEQALDYLYGPALLQQRCLLHQVRNGKDQCVGLDRAGKKSLLEQAARVSEATSPARAHARLVACAQQWRLTQPQAVASFEHEFDQTIRY
jgi:transposase-like protein